MVPIIYPVNNTTINEQKHYTSKTSRPLPDSSVREFGKLMVEEDWASVREEDWASVREEDWASVREEDSAGAQEEALQDILKRYLDKAAPKKTVRLGPQKNLKSSIGGERGNTLKMANRRNIWILLIVMAENLSWPDQARHTRF